MCTDPNLQSFVTICDKNFTVRSTGIFLRYRSLRCSSLKSAIPFARYIINYRIKIARRNLINIRDQSTCIEIRKIQLTSENSARELYDSCARKYLHGILLLFRDAVTALFPKPQILVCTRLVHRGIRVWLVQVQLNRNPGNS